MANYKRTETYESNVVKWEIIPDTNDNDFTPLVNRIIDNKMSCNLDGPAGSGKSTLLKQLMKKMDD